MTIRRKLVWLIAARAAMISGVVGAAVLVDLSRSETLPVDPLLYLLGLTYILTIGYVSTLRYVEQHRWLVDVQLVTDALIVSALVMLTGGVTSYFSTLYALPIVGASVLQSRRGGVMVGVLGSLMYVALVVAQYTGALELPGAEGGRLPPFRLAAFTVGLNVFGFLGVALLSGYLAEGLRRADLRFERASTALADLQAFSQHVIDSLTSGLLTTDGAGRVTSFNHAAEAITGLDAVHVVGRSVLEVLQLPSGDGIGLLASRSRDLVRRLETPFRRPTGQAIEIGFSAAPLLTPTGQAGYLVMFQDVTEIKRLEREVRAKQRLAAVGEMAAGIAHEIRNPLASMSGSIQILRQELPLTDEQAQLMDIVRRESERLNETIRSFLAYARLQRLSSAKLDLRTMLGDTATLLRNSTECRDHHQVALDVPDTEVVYEADEGQIRQIVWNLATNGLRAMPGGGTLTLGTRLEPAPTGVESDVVFSVADEGVGIPHEELDQIFQPFRGAFARGTGLGLAIVHRIVSDYGGEIRVTSQPGRGTTVRVRLPAPAAVVAQ